MERDLIKDVGRLEVPGRPILYGTTDEFLRQFGLQSLKELPSLDLYEDSDADNSLELLNSALQGIEDRVFVLDCFQIARDTIGKAIPNTPMLGAFMKVSGMYELEYFKDKMKSVLKKLPPNLIEANMVAIQRAFDEVH